MWNSCETLNSVLPHLAVGKLGSSGDRTTGVLNLQPRVKKVEHLLDSASVKSLLNVNIPKVNMYHFVSNGITPSPSTPQ